MSGINHKDSSSSDQPLVSTATVKMGPGAKKNEGSESVLFCISLATVRLRGGGGAEERRQPTQLAINGRMEEGAEPGRWCDGVRRQCSQFHPDHSDWSQRSHPHAADHHRWFVVGQSGLLISSPHSSPVCSGAPGWMKGSRVYGSPPPQVTLRASPVKAA